jgi:transmembrane sensor
MVQTDELSRSVDFEGGSRAILEPDSKGTLSHYSPGLVEVTLQDGVVKMDVTQRPGRRWVVKAGKFRVAVVGTAFVVNRDEGSGAFGVTVSRGKVSLEGPRLTGRVVLGAGESFRWDPDQTDALGSGPASTDSDSLDQEERLAMPKSSTLMLPSAVNAMLLGLRSRWMMPRSCAALRPSAIWAASRTASDTGMRRSACRAVTSASVGPSTSSMTSAGEPPTDSRP